jgi:branched-chain amino acid transport system substrate-binding protein
MRYTKGILALLLAVGLIVFSLAGVKAASAGSAPEKIRFGSAISLSGWLASSAEIGQVQVMKLWEQEVNARGGIYVPEYDRRIPVELVLFDDKSDPSTTARMVEKLIVEEKVDFILPPHGTAWHFAMAPIANQYGYPFFGSSITSEKLRSKAVMMPYFFVIEMQWANIGPDIVELALQAGAKSAAVIFASSLYGIEGSGHIVPLLVDKGVEVSVLKSYPYDILDTSPILKKIKASNVDALIALGYIEDGLLIAEQAKIIGLAPKFMYISLAPTAPVFYEKFGKTVEGIFGQGGWNQDHSGASEWAERFVKRWGRAPDHLVSAQTIAGLQIMEQCIEKVGLDRDKVKAMMAAETFHTIWGDVKFVDQYNTLGPTVSQVQGGRYVRVAPESLRMADPALSQP